MNTMNEQQQQIAQMQRELVNSNTQVQRLTAENQQLYSQVTTGLSSLPQLVNSMVSVVGELKERGKPSLIDAKGLGKPQVYDEKEENFPKWVRKTENYIVGVLGEGFRKVLSWAVEQEDPILHPDWDAEFGTLADEEDRVDGVDEKVNQLYTALTSLTDDDSLDIVVGAGAGNGLEAWRKLHKRWDPSTGGRKRNLLKSIIAPPRVKLEELAGCLERWQEQVRKYEKRRNDAGEREKVSDDVKMAALEMIVPTDLENHLVLNKYRLRSFEDAYREVVTILEARTGVRLKQPSIKYSGAARDPDAMDVDALHKGKKGKGKGGKGDWQLSSHAGGTAGKGGKQPAAPAPFQGYCDGCGKWGHKKADCRSKPQAPAGGPAGAKDGKGGKAAGKKGGKKGKGKGKGTGSLEEQEPEAEGNALDIGPLYLHSQEPAATDLSPLSPDTEEWIRFNYDSGAAVTAFPNRFATKDLKGNGQTYRTASGELIPDAGAVRVKAEDEYGQMRSIKGRVAGVHKPLASAARCAEMGQNTWLTQGGGWMLHKDSRVSKKICKILAAEARKADHKMLPIYEERGVYNFYLKMNKKGQVSPLETQSVENLTHAELVAKVQQLEEQKASGFSRQPAKA